MKKACRRERRRTLFGPMIDMANAEQVHIESTGADVVMVIPAEEWKSG